MSLKNHAEVPKEIANHAFHVMYSGWNKLHVPAMTFAYALDPEFIDVEHQDLPTFHDDWDAVTKKKILGSEEAALEAKEQWINDFKPLVATEMHEGSALEGSAKRLTAFQWWRLHMKSRVPKLSKVAVTVTAMPVAAPPCEGIWSSFEYIQRDKRRGSMNSETVEIQVFVGANLKLERKAMQQLWYPQSQQWVNEDHTAACERRVCKQILKLLSLVEIVHCFPTICTRINSLLDEKHTKYLVA